MPVAEHLQPPEWITNGAEIKGGLDLLGLRLPVQFIGGNLLDGVTSVTPSVRYLAFRSWLIYRYGQTGRADSWQTFTDFAARIESALVLANLTQERSIGGLVGSDEALERLAQGKSRIQISPLVKSPASTIYAGPSDELGISRSRDNARVPGLVRERGLPIAEAVDQRFARIPVVERLIRDDEVEDVSVDDLSELGVHARIDQIPDDERDLLLAALVPARPLPKERTRIGTYAGLLALALRLKLQPTESNFFDTVCSPERFGEPLIDHIADGWATYCVRDAIAITQEAVLAAVMEEILAQPDGGLVGVDRNFVISALLERVEEHDSALRDLGLLSYGESFTELSFAALQNRLRAHLVPAAPAQNGIARWAANLTEPILYKRALRSGAGSLSLAAVAWVMAAIRVGEVVRERIPEYSSLSYQGWRRLGLSHVVLPELKRFQRENRPLHEVVAELAFRTVQQHLQIAWSRLQIDLRRDVALLTAEGNKWYGRSKRFWAGRTVSRIQQALSWLGQLNLINQTGLTSDGEVVLRRALQVLSEEASA